MVGKGWRGLGGISEFLVLSCAVSRRIINKNITLLLHTDLTCGKIGLKSEWR